MMKPLISLILCLTFVFSAEGQISVLLKKLETAQGKERIDLLNEISEKYTNDSEGYAAVNYARQAIKEAEQINYTDGLAVAYYFLGEGEFLKDDLKAAEKAFLNWYKIRKKQGDLKKVQWATRGIAQFYASQLNDQKTEKYYKRLLKLEEEQGNFYSQLGILLTISSYFQNGPKVYGQRPLALKKTSKYHKIILKKGELQLDDNYKATLFDAYYLSEIENAMDKSDFKLAEKIAECWLETKEDLVSVKVQYATARLIARAFYDRKHLGLTKEYVEDAIEFAEATNDLDLIPEVYFYACFMMREVNAPLEALEFAIKTCEQGKRIRSSFRHISALNASINYFIFSKEVKERASALQLLKNWRKTLNKSYNQDIVDWCDNNIKLLE